MSERITEISMQAFRGIPGAFTLALEGGRSCVILGENGSGKSCVADAVEWYFTGSIEFLRREGRHEGIRHTGALNDISTEVAVTTDGDLGGTVTQTANPPQPALNVGQREVFLLRGTTLADFMDATKGNKWKHLAELLGLEGIDSLRLDLQTVANETATAATSAAAELTESRSTVEETGASATEASVMERLDELCALANVGKPPDFKHAVSDEWKNSITPAESQSTRVAALAALLSQLRPLHEQPRSAASLGKFNELIAGDHAEEISTLPLWRAANSLVNGEEIGDSCPLCGQPVSAVELSARIVQHVLELSDVSQQFLTSRNLARSAVDSLKAQLTAAAGITADAGAQQITLPSPPGTDGATAILQEIDDDRPMTLQTFENSSTELQEWAINAVEQVEAAMPEPPSDTMKALWDAVSLVGCAQRWAKATVNAERAGSVAELAQKIHVTYAQLERDFLRDVLERISGRVADLYALLHPEGGISNVTVETSGDKGVELRVDFHGITESPPQKVLSESHLNSLGLALFLAMAEAFNDELGFIILDDVINSLDAGHRRQLANVLAQQFDDRQLIVLTHDELFFAQLSRLAPNWIREHFTSWSYDEGPRRRRYEGQRLAEDAHAALDADDRAGALQKARRALEEFLQELSERLGALLPFRRGVQNDRRENGELLRALRRLLRERAPSMKSELSELLDAIETDLGTAENVDSHASQQVPSFSEAKMALENLERLRQAFVCPECSTAIWHVGTEESCRCECGERLWPPPRGS